MKHKRFWRITIFVAIVCLILFSTLVVLRELRQPPYEKLRQAVSMLDSVRQCQFRKPSQESYQSAHDLLEAGEQALNNTVASWWPFKSFDSADSLLSESIRMSQLACEQFDQADLRQKSDVYAEIKCLQDSLRVWRRLLDTSLPRTENELLYQSAYSNLHLAIQMFKQNRSESARNYINIVMESLGKLQHPQSWNPKWIRFAHEWAATTISESRKTKSKALIVDKTRHQLYVISGGRITDSMSCDLGYNSGHQKLYSGDGATPEGRYNITRINHNSKYYRALLLDYPNSEDRKRFRNSVEDGSIPRNSKIGGMIEVHGNGGTGRDWTDGCVAVTDKDMLKLIKLASVGMAVTIVRIWDDRP